MHNAGPGRISGECVCRKTHKCLARISLKFTPEGKILLLDKEPNTNPRSAAKFNYKLKRNDPIARDIQFYNVVPRANPSLHSDFCSHQVEAKNRTYDEHALAINPKKEKAKYCNFGKFQTFTKNYREAHTSRAKSTQNDERKQILEEWGIPEKHGADFVPNILNMKAEKCSSRYHQLKKGGKAKLISDLPQNLSP